ncbi:MAG: NlpC/P60 family protein [Actinomycetota bacterium]
MPRPLLRTARAALLLATLAAALIAALPVQAAPRQDIAAKRAEAEAARAEMARLGEDLTPAIERYNRAVLELEQVEEDIAFNRKMIRATKDNLRRTQFELHRKLEQSYRVGEPDLLASVLGQETLTKALAVTELFTRTQTQAGDLITGLRADRRSLNERQRKLDRQEARAKDLRAQREAERAAIEQGIAEQQSLAAGLEDEIAQLIAEEQARQERLRQQALAALAAQEAANQGGGGGGGDELALGGSADLGAAAAVVEAIELPPTDGSIGAQAVSVAMQFLGTPYVWGGESPGGFDCSGLTKYAYGQVGVGLSHFTGAQWNEGVRVPAEQLLPGDLVFFRSDLGHMGMYIGGGQYVHAPQTGDVVKISSLGDRGDYQGAVRPY